MNFGDILEKWEKTGGTPQTPDNLSGGMQAHGSAPRPSGNSGKNKKADGKPQPAIHPLDLWLNRYGVQDKDAEPEPVSRTESIRRRAEQRRRLKAMQPEAKLDLHGLTQEEAEHSLDSFFRECRQKGLRKILIVHGKGLHSEGQPVLFSVVRSYLERNPFAGDFGQGAKEDGGSGALWVILKQD